MVRDLALAGLGLAAQRLLDGNAAASAARPDQPAKSSLRGLDLAALLEAAAAEGARRFLDGWQSEAPAPAPAPKRRRPGAASQA